MAALAAAAVAVTPSCTKTIQSDSFSQEATLQERDALEEFAAVLSKVVVSNEEVREFLKEEALKQFDRDYDVFYPYVKGHIFSSGETFREMLIANENYEGQIETIERSVPKLTILIPSYSWLDIKCFDVKTWDTANDQLCVGYDDRAAEHKLYYKGELMGSLSADAVPAFPVLIAKSNERMKVTVSTKGGENTYAFADPAFDGAAYEARTKGNWGLWGKIDGYVDNPNPAKDLYSQTGDFIATSELNGVNADVIKAYNEFAAGTTAGVQRDYIYYGMTKQNSTNGLLNTFMRDMVYRFRLTLNGLYFAADEAATGSDLDLQKTLGTGRGDRPDFVHALPRIWGDGNYEIRMDCYLAFPNSGTASIGTMTFSIAPEEAMYVKRLYYTFQWIATGNNWSSYVIKREDVESKWYYPGDHYDLTLQPIGSQWNLAKQSDNLFIRIYEYDASGQVTDSSSRRYKQSKSVSANANASFGKVGLGVSGSYGEETEWTDQYNFTREIGSDQLGTSEVCYIDNYVNYPMTKNGKSGYQLKTWGNAYYAFSLLPYDTRNDYQIRQFLLGRKNRNN